MRVDDICAIMKKVAKVEIMPRFRNLKETEVQFKEPGEFVTAADVGAEKMLSRELQELYPYAIVTGEEDISINLGRLNELINSECGFLIDPIDGTNNFIKGNEQFAVMVTALQHGEVGASWIYLPAKDLMAFARKGEGAFINGERVTINNHKSNISDMIGAAHINRMPPEIRVKAKENLSRFKENRPAFCAGYDYVALLTGEKDFSVYYRTLIWDHLPGTLLFKEAGGYVMGLDGKPYTPKNEGTGLLSAPSLEAWQKIKENLFE
ncbi:inositol monophosphatase family protein [Pseudemcibacter aquimaris]|uniref:inositol monophosphatase family protein n=1 Tax=Pseudemcibacter aquimaris TaxID=2857064 RepID=UPI002011EEB0|nr:inositol monophosphatase family protein [Pseudemcibacter aquimaris]MCC3860937.1 hypothetical protein [Pseudemcibacter aquimaris]WDU59756.1 hypothetical protein KW060_05740 [Pseudemcibacter aquimaris]